MEKNKNTFLIHELFHIRNQNNPTLRYKLYNSLGFHHCNEIILPSELLNKKITNPDAPRLDVYINVHHKENIFKVTHQTNDFR